MVTTVGNTADKVIIADNATPASGTWAVYLNPETIVDGETTVFLLQEVAGSETLVENWGGRRYQGQFKNCKWALSGANGNMEKLKRAIQYWNVQSSTLYLTNKDKNGYSQATTGSDDGASVVQIQCRIQSITHHNTDADNHTFDVNVIGANTS